MAKPEDIEMELRAYLEDEIHLKKSDKLEHLMSIFNKHFALDKMEYILNDRDLEGIVSHAKATYPGITLPMKISRKEVYSAYVNYVLVIEAFVLFLNGNKLLKRLVKFDYSK